MTYPQIPPAWTLPPLISDQQLTSLTRGKLPAGTDTALLLSDVSAAIRGVCGWHVSPVIDETMTLDGPGRDLLAVPTLQLLEVLAASQRSRGRDAVSEVIDPLDLEWSRAGLIRSTRCWTSRLGGITLTVRHGYDGEAVGLAGVVAAIAARQATAPTGAVREQAGPLAVQWSTTAPGVAGGVALLDHEKALLAPWTLPRLP